MAPDASDQTLRKRLMQARRSPLQAYIDATVGRESGFGRFLLYEFLTSLLGPIPGGLGLVLRKKFYPALFKHAQSGLLVGRNVTLRHPGKISLGKNVVFDDYALIDARSSDGSDGVTLQDDVIVNRNCVLKAKKGSICLGRRTNVGSNSVIISYSGVEIGEAVLIAGGCHITGGGYRHDDVSTLMADNGVCSKGPIKIGDNVWIGTGAIVLDGVTIGSHAVIGAGAVVNKDVDDNAIVAGVPARLVRYRNSSDGAA